MPPGGLEKLKINHQPSLHFDLLRREARKPMADG
jgi:hypothetical protein